MPKYIVHWVTKLGAEYFEEAQEYPTMEDCARATINSMSNSSAKLDEAHDDRVYFKDIFGNLVILGAGRVDHVAVMPEEKVRVEKPEEK